MINRSGKVLGAVLLAVALVTVASSAEAGVVYTDEASFNTAMATAGLNQAWTEDFESFGIGGVADPLTIAGGMAEVVDGGNASVFAYGPTGNSWLQNGAAQTNATVRGAGDSALGLQAISFNFGNQYDQTVTFFGTGGPDTSANYAAGTDEQTTNFVGWIGTGSESVLTAQFDTTGGITLDNLDGYIAHAPEPGTFLLFGMGAAGLFFASRRRKSKSAK